MSLLRKRAAPGADPVAIGHEVLAFLSRLNLSATPEHYAFGYLVTSEPNGLAAAAVDAILLQGRPLGDADAARILAMRTKPAATAAAPDPHDAVLRAQTVRLADLASDAAETSRAFGLDLSSNLSEVADCTPVVAGMIDAMILRTQETETRLRAASREIETLREEVDAVRDDAARDALTGLLNRRGAMATLKRPPPRPKGWIALADVDHFKSVNDRFGHSIGDRVLKSVAASLAQSCDGQVVARWGGEEFLIVLEGLDAAHARAVCERARSDLEHRSFRLRSTEQPIGTVTVSIGLAPLSGADVQAAIDAADRNLYQAKREGRNRVAPPPTAGARR